MDDYNFDNDEGQFGETRRLDDINKEVIKLEAAKKGKAPTEELGDKNAFLNTFQSEKFDQEKDVKVQEQPQTANADKEVNAAIPKQPQEQSFATAKITPVAQEVQEDDLEDDRERALRMARDRRMMKIGLTIAVIVGLLVFVVGFIFMTTFLRNGTIHPTKEEEPTQSVVLIEGIKGTNGLSVRDLDTHQVYTVRTTEETTYRDPWEKEIAFHALEPGDVVLISMKASAKEAIQIWFPEDIWIKEDVTDFTIDTEKKTMQLALEGISGEGVLTYTDDTLFLYKEKGISPKELQPCDILQLQGKGNKIYSVVVLSYHGYYTISNSSVDSCFGQIDDGEIIPLKEGEKYAVSEGAHTLTITGENIEPRIENLFIVPKEESIIDLSAIQEKTGVLIVKADVPEYQLFVNSVEVDPTEPIVLPLGKEQDVVVSKEGYVTWNEKVILNQASLTVYATLEQEVEKALVSFTSKPSGATVLVNGVDFGTTPLEKEIEFGSYTIELQLNGYDSYLGTLLADKASVAVNAELSPHKEDVNLELLT